MCVCLSVSVSVCVTHSTMIIVMSSKDSTHDVQQRNPGQGTEVRGCTD